MKSKFKTIGILGGMGPAASAVFHNSLIKQSQKMFGAIDDGDYPVIISYDIHLKDFDNTGQLDNGNTLQELITGAKKLESFGAEVIVMACNTVHYFHKEIQSELNSQLVNMIEETSKVVKEDNLVTVGILSSEMTNELKLYPKYLEKKGVKSITANPDEQQVLNQVILNVMGGTQGGLDTQQLLKIINSMEVEGIVLGCTELPLAISQNDSLVKLYNTIDIAAKATLWQAFLKG